MVKIYFTNSFFILFLAIDPPSPKSHILSTLAYQLSTIVNYAIVNDYAHAVIVKRYKFIDENVNTKPGKLFAIVNAHAVNFQRSYCQRSAIAL